MQQWFAVAQDFFDRGVGWFLANPDRIVLVIIAAILWVQCWIVKRNLNRAELKIDNLTRAVASVEVQAQRLLFVSFRDPQPTNTPTSPVLSADTPDIRPIKARSP